MAGFLFAQIEHLLVEWSQYNESPDSDNSDEEPTDNNGPTTDERKYQLEFVRSIFTEDEIKEKFPHLLATENACVQNEEMLNRTIADFETKLTPYVIRSSNGGKVHSTNRIPEATCLILFSFPEILPRFRSISRVRCGEYQKCTQLVGE